MQRVGARLGVIANAKSRFLFFMIKESEEATLAPFRLFESVDVLLSFRSFIGSISLSSAQLVLLLCTSGHRFRFFDRSTIKCPFCPSNSWLTGHLFSCSMVEPTLARNGVTLCAFEEAMRVGSWKRVLFLFFEVLTIWKNSFADCTIEDSTIQILWDDAIALL
jgi:hypothetical protein